MDSVLHEIRNVKQERGPGRRRWFESENLELIVWLDRSDCVTGFQLCYDLGEGEHALTWRSANGFVHSAIDSGEDGPFANRTPILQPDGEVPWSGLAQLFEERSSTLEPDLRQLVHDKLAEQSGAAAR